MCFKLHVSRTWTMSKFHVLRTQCWMTWSSYQTICLQVMMAVIELVFYMDIAICCFHRCKLGNYHSASKISFSYFTCRSLPGAHATNQDVVFVTLLRWLFHELLLVLWLLSTESVTCREKIITFLITCWWSIVYCYELLSSGLSHRCLHQILVFLHHRHASFV
jgi:hypothetical protein